MNAEGRIFLLESLKSLGETRSTRILWHDGQGDDRVGHEHTLTGDVRPVREGVSTGAVDSEHGKDFTSLRLKLVSKLVMLVGEVSVEVNVGVSAEVGDDSGEVSIGY